MMFAAVVLLATRIYIFSELVAMLAFVAILVVSGTGIVLLFLLLQECGRWIVRRILEVAQRGPTSLPAGVSSVGARLRPDSHLDNTLFPFTEEFVGLRDLLEGKGMRQERP
jgi:hypothetical protein